MPNPVMCIQLFLHTGAPPRYSLHHQAHHSIGSVLGKTSRSGEFSGDHVAFRAPIPPISIHGTVRTISQKSPGTGTGKHHRRSRGPRDGRTNLYRVVRLWRRR